jgi:hypothetical protein
MQPKPVRDTREPAYPTRREVLAGAASFVLFKLIGGENALADGKADTKRKGITVAPIFGHGEGRGSTGCIVVSPPVFLSEEEGMQIIREELAKHGIRLKQGGVLKGVRIPMRFREFEVVKKSNGFSEFKESVVEVPERSMPVELDGIDSERKVAVEFVSRADYSGLGGPMSLSSVRSYQFKEVAERAAGIIKKQGKDEVFLGVFYDPLVARMGQGKEGSQKLLRKQAQDFVGWLKKQKVIS